MHAGLERGDLPSALVREDLGAAAFLRVDTVQLLRVESERSIGVKCWGSRLYCEVTGSDGDNLPIDKRTPRCTTLVTQGERGHRCSTN